MFIEKPKAGGDFDPVPAGTHLAVCWRVVDLGTQLTTFNGQTKDAHKVLVSWELPDETIEIDGQPRPMIQSKRYTWSMHEKATLRLHLEAWRGRKFTDDDFDGPNRFNVRKLLGLGCMLSIVHEERDGKTYANISSVSKLLKGTTTPPPVNPITYFSMQFPADYDPTTFAAFPDWLKDLISKSPEHQEIQRLRSGSDPFEPNRDWREEMADDEVPF
jgi:hypothetical protein